jgi:GDP-D-mannose 3',5'-epimerase
MAVGANMKRILILGASGFLGQHLEYRLKAEGHFVVSAGRSRPKYRPSIADEQHILDLRDTKLVHVLMMRHEFDEVYQLAGDVGGLGHIGTGQHDAEIMTNSTKINLAVLDVARRINPGKIFFASSQCVYPDPGIDPFAQERIAPIPACREQDASFNTFPFAQEKLYAEALYRAHAAAYGLEVRIGRLGNTYGPYCTWNGSRAKAVAAICRKISQAPYAGTVELWGSGDQTRSFTYVDDAVEGMIRLMASDYGKPVNLAYSHSVTIIELFDTICRAACKILAWKPTAGPVGVRSRNSNNDLCKQVLGWEPDTSLFEGLTETYPWIAEQVLTSHPELTTL